MIELEPSKQSTLEKISHDAIPPLVQELGSLINDYLRERPQLSLNSLSKRCGVSEATLRRISKGQIKSLPTIATVLDLLFYITGIEEIPVLIQKHPGPIADFLKETMPWSSIQDINFEFSKKLNLAIADSTTFIIYSLCANPEGLTEKEVLDLFGQTGAQRLKQLLTDDLVYTKDDVWRARIENFSWDHRLFIRHTKAIVDFIKPEKLKAKTKGSPFFHLATGGVSLEAYQEILRIQEKALLQCVRILNSPENAGPVPAFLISILDTLSLKAAYEMKEL